MAIKIDRIKADLNSVCDTEQPPSDKFHSGTTILEDELARINDQISEIAEEFNRQTITYDSATNQIQNRRIWLQTCADLASAWTENCPSTSADDTTNAALKNDKETLKEIIANCRGAMTLPIIYHFFSIQAPLVGTFCSVMTTLTNEYVAI